MFASQAKLLKKVSKERDGKRKKKENFLPLLNHLLPNLNYKEDPVESVIEERKAVYGDPFLSHQAIGLAWEGVFRNRFHHIITLLNKEYGEDIYVGKLFPADLVAEMLAAFKVVRLARPIFLEDSAIDAQAYIKFSVEFRSRRGTN